MREIKSKLAKFSPFFQSAVVVLIASLFVMSVVYAATTIGSDITTAGLLTVTGRATTTSATTTNYLMVGDGFTVPNGFDYDADLAVSDDVLVGGTVTTTAALWVGTGVANSLNVAGGDLYVQDDVEIDGDLVVSGSNFDLASATATTTPGIFSRDETTGTSTVSVGDITTGEVKKQVGCLELAGFDGAYYNCFINGLTASGTPALTCQAGRCN
ncbi:MAG: hypothetical protein WC675_02980 [Patescibacteria group bacterium]|jgi:hypothetical protein